MACFQWYHASDKCIKLLLTDHGTFILPLFYFIGTKVRQDDISTRSFSISDMFLFVFRLFIVAIG